MVISDGEKQVLKSSAEFRGTEKLAPRDYPRDVYLHQSLSSSSLLNLITVRQHRMLPCI